MPDNNQGNQLKKLRDSEVVNTLKKNKPVLEEDNNIIEVLITEARTEKEVIKEKK